jgi:hypothetical protein
MYKHYPKNTLGEPVITGSPQTEGSPNLTDGILFTKTFVEPPTIVEEQ